MENAKAVKEKKVVHPTETATEVKKSGRPKRNKIINQEDIDNLKIALHTTKSVDEFIKVMW